jgi:hypothetical protein
MIAKGVPVRLLAALGFALLVALILSVTWALADPGHGGDDHGGFVTDDPSGQEDPAAGLDGAGMSSVEAFLGG